MGNGFEISTLSGNGGTSTNLLSRLDEWFVRPKFDFIHVNCGLHDLARDRDAFGPRVPLDRYEANLIQIIRRLQGETRSVLAWASTTPVIDERHAARKGFDRREEDVMAYNDVALRMTEEEGLPVNDLHRVVEQTGLEECIGEDGVHVTDLGNAVLVDAVTEFLTRLCSQGDGQLDSPLRISSPRQ